MSGTLTLRAMLGFALATTAILIGCNQNREETAAASSTEAQAATAAATQTAKSDGVAVKDPTGRYKFFSDPSITRQPEKNAVFGNGQTYSLEYDGSKSQKETDTLFFQITYVDKEGEIRPITGSSFDQAAKGTFTTTKKIYDSNADGRPGFMEVFVVQNAKVVGGEQGVTGQQVMLGMYPIRIEAGK